MSEQIYFNNQTKFDNLGNTINCTTINSTFNNTIATKTDSIQVNTPGNDLQINGDTVLVGNLTVDGNYSLLETAGQLRLQDVILAGTSGSTSGQHLQIIINGQLYKIELKNP